MTVSKQHAVKSDKKVTNLLLEGQQRVDTPKQFKVR